MKKTIQFNAATVSDTRDHEQYLAYLEAANDEFRAEMEEKEIIERTPIAWLLKQGKAAGPLSIHPIGMNSGKRKSQNCQAIPKNHRSGEWGDISDTGSSSGIDILDAKGNILATGKIINLTKDSAIIKPVGWTVPNTGGAESYFIRKSASSFSYPYVDRLKKNPNIAWPPRSKPEPPASLPAEMPEAWNHENDEDFLEALAEFVHAENLFSVKGPPGTGKTHLLAHVASLLAHTGKSVVLASISHAAVDNSLLEIARICKENGFGITPSKKQGDPLGEKLTNAGVIHASPAGLNSPDAFTHFPIVGMTLASLMKSKDMPKPDVLILEEAGQMAAYQAAAASTIGEKMLLFGDEQQLEPILIAKHRNILDSAASAMELIRTRLPHKVKTLKVNHRSNEPTVKFNQKHTYKDVALTAGKNANTQLEKPHQIQLQGKTFELPTQGVVFLEVSHKNRKNGSPEEAKACAEIISTLLGEKMHTPEGIREITTDDFAVLSPNRRQAQMVLRELQTRAETKDADITCGTVHKLQGQGRHIVIFSITSSHTSYIEATSEFLFNPALWNVATSRARALCIILGNKESLTAARPKTLKGLEMKQNALKQIEIETNS